MASSSRTGNGAMMQTFAVTVPPGIGPGQQFQASLDGQLTMVIVPHGSGPSSTLHVQMRPSRVQKYAVTIPNNVQPGARFQANLGGQLVWLHCPRHLVLRPKTFWTFDFCLDADQILSKLGICDIVQPVFPAILPGLRL